MGVVDIQAMLADQPGQEGAVGSSGDIVTGRDREESAGVVVEADGVVEAGGLGDLLAEGPSVREDQGRIESEQDEPGRRRRVRVAVLAPKKPGLGVPSGRPIVLSGAMEVRMGVTPFMPSGKRM